MRFCTGSRYLRSSACTASLLVQALAVLAGTLAHVRGLFRVGGAPYSPALAARRLETSARR